MAVKPANYNQMSPEDRALWDYQNAGNEFIDGGAAQYGAGQSLEYSQLNPQDLARQQQSAYGGITTDPSLINAEQDALSQLEQRAKGTGLTTQDEADFSKLQGQVNQRNRGRQGAIQQEMHARGMSGSGMDLVARMQAGQDATETEALAALEKSAQAQAGQRDAADRLGNRASTMRGQQFNEQAQKAQAQDTIAQFNARNQVSQQQANWQAQNQAAQQNWNRTNQTSDRNVASQYDFRHDKMGTQQNNSQMAYNKATDDYNRAQIKKQQKQEKKAGMGRMIGGAAGMAAGSMGGPMGAAMGAQMGSAAGGAYSNFFAHGGTVPGQAPFPGTDTEENDIFSAQLTPGEVVVPASIAHDPVASAKFVAQQNAMSGGDPMASKYVAQNDQVKAEEPRAPFYPTPDGKPIPKPAQKPQSNAQVTPAATKFNAPVSEPVLAALAQKNPGLVEQYRARMADQDAKVAGAKSTQTTMDMANMIGKGATDFANSQKTDIMLKNRMQDLGKRPDVVEAKRQDYDGSTLDKLGARGVQDAEAERAHGEDSFFKEQQLGAMDKANTAEASRKDPNSPESQAARAFLKSVLPSAAKNPSIDKMSAEQLSQSAPMLMKKWESDRAQGNFNSEMSLKRQALTTKETKPPTPDQFKVSGFGRRMEQAEREMADIAKSGYDRSDASSGAGSKLPDMLRSDSGLRQDQAERNFINALLRRESGAAIGPAEFDSAEKQYFPRSGDSEAVKAQKERNRAQSLIAMKAEAGDQAWKAIPAVTPESTTSKPAPHGKTVIQHGVKFTWDGQEYVPEE